MIGIFNRSHYEDVLVVRVKKLVPKRSAGAALRPHQRLRAPCSPTRASTIVKFFLHISKDEQKRPLPRAAERPAQALEVQPRTTCDERTHWDDYQEAFEDALQR